MTARRPSPTRIGHLVLNVRDLQKSLKFYTEIVGLEVSDYIGETMAFLRCGVDHHDLALSEIPSDHEQMGNLYEPGRPGLEHFAYRLESLDELKNAAEFLEDNNIDIVRGIGKHGPGANLFLVFKDPDDNYCEFYADMIQVTEDNPHEAQHWVNDLKAFDRWEFREFVVDPPAGWGTDPS